MMATSSDLEADRLDGSAAAPDDRSSGLSARASPTTAPKPSNSAPQAGRYDQIFLSFGCGM
ncbi:hypothetical protein CWO90_30985 [Bradyrhizobium sp. Leo121]|nr:hypothetical protein CWO90_30985 [Bradyrhizobium sp. Leo121]